MTVKKIHFIINPGSGREEPILGPINRLINTTSIDWDLSVTKKPGDEVRFATKIARSASVEAVAVYGGDGTVSEVVKALYKSTIPVIVLPGGTANVIASSLSMPPTLELCLHMIAGQQCRLKKVDIANANGKTMVLALSTGIVVENVISSTDAEKTTFGKLAYVVSSIKTLPHARSKLFKLTIDGKQVEVEGVALIVANIGKYTLGSVSLLSELSMTDGKLDVVVIHSADLGALIDLGASLFGHVRERKNISYWQAEKVIARLPRGEHAMIDDQVVTTPQKFVLTVKPRQGLFCVPK